ncbi:Ger(x)C family spore germination protein [Paenibacillus sp. HN-1]|nr:Ger(x)C family spore germination protein [Paenibacillus sp. CGMCC 1.18879]MBY9079897.1 Ger(x)C family spore germination protein [Paenibacillus sp. CGMCC 1.18879]MBY9084538.1 Ger(x)C family spore germination protein [Paenibacillus sinensis]
MMRSVRLGVKLLLILAISLTSGCWNYKEVEDMSIVAGVAVDKGEQEGELRLSAELVDTSGEPKNTKVGFKIASLTGDTMFETVRNMISVTGKRLFWSHSKAIIFSEEIAREGLIKVMDWYNRDTETRSDIYIFVSTEKTAREILELNSPMQAVVSFNLEQLMRDEHNAGTAPVVEIWDFIGRIESKGKYAVAPLIRIEKSPGGKKTERVDGTAVFARDRMIGKLSGEESRYMMFASNDVKGGILTVKDKSGKPEYSLEILSSKTRIHPVLRNGRLRMEVSTVTHVSLGEVMMKEDLQKNGDIKEIEKLAEEQLKAGIEQVIDKAQHTFHSDIFGYGEIVHEGMKNTWSKIQNSWEEEFTNLEVAVQTKIIIESSAKTSRTIRIGH